MQLYNFAKSITSYICDVKIVSLVQSFEKNAGIALRCFENNSMKLKLMNHNISNVR